MSKVKLTYELDLSDPEDSQLFNRLVKVDYLALAVWQLKHNLINELKHGDNIDCLDKVQEIIDEHVPDINDLTS